MTRSERRYYLLCGSYNLAQFFIAPIYPLFLLGRGLDLFQTNSVLATYGITVVLFEVPTGALADVAGRRLAFVLGCLVRAGAYALYTLARGFGDCVVAEFVDAIGTTFVSGAFDAWMVDGARAEGDDRPLDRVFARSAVIGRILMIGGGLASGYLAETSMLIPWFIAAGLFAATGLCGSVFMRDGAVGRRPIHGPGAIGRTARDGLAIVRRSPVLLLLCALSLASAFAAFPLFMLWPPRLRTLGIEHLRFMGWVVAGGADVRAACRVHGVGGALRARRAGIRAARADRAAAPGRRRSARGRRILSQGGLSRAVYEQRTEGPCRSTPPIAPSHPTTSRP